MKLIMYPNPSTVRDNEFIYIRYIPSGWDIALGNTSATWDVT